MPDTLTALSLYERAELDQAERLLLGLLPEARQARTPDLIISHVLLARLALARGERDTWLCYLVRLERFGQQSGSLQTQCSAWLERARVATLSNRLDVAQQTLRTAQGIWDRQTFTGLLCAPDVDNPLIAQQRLRIAQGNGADTVEDLHLAIHSARLNRQLRREIKLELLLAMALDAGERDRLAMQALDRAMRLAGEEGWLQSVIEEGQPLAALVRRWAESREQTGHPPFVTRLLQRLDCPAFASADSRSITLTAREKQVLNLLAGGLRNRAIAEHMFLSECTVKTHLHKINVKLGARSRTQALAIARGHGWLN